MDTILILYKIFGGIDEELFSKQIITIVDQSFSFTIDGKSWISHEISGKITIQILKSSIDDAPVYKNFFIVYIQSKSELEERSKKSVYIVLPEWDSDLEEPVFHWYYINTNIENIDVKKILGLPKQIKFFNNFSK